MIEYIRDIIKMTAGSPETVNAYIKAEDGSFVESDCLFMLHDDDGEEFLSIAGTYEDYGKWSFEIEEEMTKGREGKYTYCIKHGDEVLCFRQPFYIV